MNEVFIEAVGYVVTYGIFFLIFLGVMFIVKVKRDDEVLTQKTLAEHYAESSESFAKQSKHWFNKCEELEKLNKKLTEENRLLKKGQSQKSHLWGAKPTCEEDKPPYGAKIRYQEDTQ